MGTVLDIAKSIAIVGWKDATSQAFGGGSVVLDPCKDAQSVTIVAARESLGLLLESTTIRGYSMPLLS